MNVKKLILTFVFLVIIIVGILLAGMWAWVLSSRAIPPNEVLMYIVASLISVFFALYGIFKQYV